MDLMWSVLCKKSAQEIEDGRVWVLKKSVDEVCQLGDADVLYASGIDKRAAGKPA